MAKKEVYAMSFLVLDGANAELPGFFVIDKLDPKIEVHDQVTIHLGPYENEDEAASHSKDLPEETETMWMPGIAGEDAGMSVH